MNTTINLDDLLKDDNKGKQPQEQEEAPAVKINWNEVFTEWCYKIPKGYPTIVDGVFTEYEEVKILNVILEEKFGESIPLPEKALPKIPKDYNAAAKYIDNALTQKVLGIDLLGKITKRPFVDKNNIIRIEVPQKDRAAVAQKLNDAFGGVMKGSGASFTFQYPKRDKGTETTSHTYTCEVKPATAATKTDTDAKEGLSIVISYYPDYLTQYNDNNITKDNYKEVSKKLLKFINEGGVDGLNEDALTTCVNYLMAGAKGFANPKDAKKYVEILNQNSSHANTFDRFFQKNEDWYIDRSEKVFNQVRKAAVECTKTPTTKNGLAPDKWCPGDVYFIKRGAEGEILSTLEKAMKMEAPQGIPLINNLFSDKFMEPESKKSIVAVSLKMEDAQAGKLKSALEMYTNTKTSYNLDDEDLKADQKLLVKKGNTLRDALMAGKGDVDIEWTGKGGKVCDLTKVHDPKSNTKEANTRTLACKVAAYKALTYIKDEVADNDFAQLDDALVSLVVFGLGVINKSPDTKLNDLIEKKSINPPFFKVIASKSGNGMAKPLLFKKGKLTAIALWDTTGGTDPKIRIEDNETFAGITIYMGVQIGKDKFDCAVAFRPNVTGSKQITIELQKAEHHD